MLPLLHALGSGESVLGIAARLHRLAGSLRPQDTLRLLFGTRNAKPANMLPSHLQWMVQQLDYHGAVESFIEVHTALPYFKCFVTPTNYARAINAMAGSNAGGCKLLLGLVASRLGGSNRVAFCPACAEHDLQSLGVATWYRDTQLPGVLVCSIHHCPLVEWPTQQLRSHPHRLPLPDDIADQGASISDPAYSQLAHERLGQIATMTAELLNGTPPAACPSLRWHYAAWLLQRGLAKQPAYIDQQALANAVTAYWQPLSSTSPFDRLLSDLQQSEGHWLATLCRHQRVAHHPLKHLLLMGFLTSSVGEFFSVDPIEPTRVSFSARVWEPSQDERLTLLSSLLEKESISLRQAAGRLGLSLQTVIALAQKLHIPVHRRPKKFHTHERDRLISALMEPKALTDIVKVLRASMSTLCRLLAANPEAKVVRQQRLFTKQRTANRTYLRHLRHKDKAVAWQQLRYQAPAACVWLTRHDPIWLHSFKLTLLPSMRRRRPIVDWQARDHAMVGALQEVTRTLLTGPGKPRRVSLAALAESVEHPDWLDKQLDHLPLTQRYLKEHLESIQVFQQRRLNWYRQQYEEEEGASPPDWLLRRLAGLS